MDNNSVVFLNTNDDLQSVINCFRNNKISHIPILEEERLVGMVSKTDVIDHICTLDRERSSESFGEVFRSTLVKEVMIQPVVIANADDSQSTIVSKILEKNVGSVVIVGENNELSLVTERDLLCYFANQETESLALPEKWGYQITQWLNENGLMRVSKMLSDIGI